MVTYKRHGWTEIWTRVAQGVEDRRRVLLSRNPLRDMVVSVAHINCQFLMSPVVRRGCALVLAQVTRLTYNTSFVELLYAEFQLTRTSRHHFLYTSMRLQLAYGMFPPSNRMCIPSTTAGTV